MKEEADVYHGLDVRIRLLVHGLAALLKSSSLERQKTSLWKVQVLVDDNTIVSFYSSSTCDLGTASAESNASSEP
jgi:hypothetical protein